jgi:nitroimidazol reductase NimA-like FMN-containing flavoprotein (pyridoxamine 5'-phosphate oxidase superfamily)
MEEDLPALVHEVLRDGFVVNLGVADAEGPWVAPVVYVLDDAFDLSWISIPECRHSRAIARDPRVAATVIASHDTDQERALQFTGRVEKVDGPLLEMEQRLNEKRGMAIPRSPGEILTDGYVWYRLTPDRFEIIYNTLFGYDRKTYIP